MATMAMGAMAMHRRLALSYFLSAAAVALLLAFPHARLSAAQPLPWQLCSDNSGNYTENSAYQANIRLLATALAKNASSSPTLFATGAAGTTPDVVYALALCRGDTNASSCATCVATAFQNAQQLCALNKDVTMYDDPCILRFSDRDFLANVTDNRGIYVAWNYNNVSAATAAAFDAASGRLVNATAEYAAAHKLRRFGTGEEGFDETYPKIYSLAQCTPDMTAADCRSCLWGIIGRMTPEYFVGKPGGRVFGVRCNFRFETYRFFSGRSLLQLPGPPAPPPAQAPVNMTPAATGEGRARHRPGRVLAIVLPIVAAMLVLIVACFCFRRRPTRKPTSLPYDIQSIGSLLLDLSTLRAATENFAESNKLGEGGFGAVYKVPIIPCFGISMRGPTTLMIDSTCAVSIARDIVKYELTKHVGVDASYIRSQVQNGVLALQFMPSELQFADFFTKPQTKGVLSGGQEIAVKRLSQSSRQGLGELKAELVLVAKLQHKNLVRLVGVCLEEHERILVYEYMPNRSLDTILFDSEKSKELDWGKRLKIVDGVARGLQYLHEDSQLRIVHRDLKASNVLLGSDYNPKISDFGLAKLFGWDQTQDVTSHIAGTYGYMAPEYAMRGRYSVKSDVFSFGVLILETITGRKNIGFTNSEQCVDLLSLVWEHWTMGTIEELLDPSLGSRSPKDQMLKLISIGLLCVQDSPADRPMMSAVNVMLSGSTVSLQAPSRPTFCIHDQEETDADSGACSESYPGAFRSSASNAKAASPS